LIFRSTQQLGDVPPTTGHWLDQWAARTPDAVFLAERSGAGWREERYAAVREATRALASSLIGRGLGPTTPIMVLSGNGIDHGLLALSAQYAGIPIAPVAEQYSLIDDAHPRLRHALELIKPKLVYTDDAERYKKALSSDLFEGIDIIASRAVGRAQPFKELLQGDADADVDDISVGPDNVVKLLMTSGSTSSPKAVCTTHRMMCANQTQLADALPFLRDRPPRILDWLPWNHVFGGSHNFNMMLANGGALYIDDGKPMKGQTGRSLENMRLVTGTLAFNVPIGFSMQLDALQKDAGLKRRFFADLDLVFYAGASLPKEVWDGFSEMAKEVRGEAPLMTSSWGLTETAPACLLQHERIDRSGIIGVPLSGVTAKLLPENDGRFEIRVKGPNVTPGYFQDPDKTAEAFDEEGFLVTGDAVRFVNDDNPDRGVSFAGRIAEDFKLLSGIWVRAATLRLELLGRLAPLAADLVITGEDRADIGVLIFPTTETANDAKDDGGALISETLRQKIAKRLNAPGKTTSSTRIGRALVLADAPSIVDAEITAKGNLNFRRVRERRADLVARLYDDSDLAVILPETST